MTTPKPTRKTDISADLTDAADAVGKPLVFDAEGRLVSGAPSPEPAWWYDEDELPLSAPPELT